MSLHQFLSQWAAGNMPLRVALIGAVKFGSMFLAQARPLRGEVGDFAVTVVIDRERPASK
ncbi:MAG: hypothetical protein HY322_13755 [Betaproteobacteria bacterium]|nr:hypothetical protein [Betaproteobacteria bacterium]